MGERAQRGTWPIFDPKHPNHPLSPVTLQGRAGGWQNWGSASSDTKLAHSLSPGVFRSPNSSSFLGREEEKGCRWKFGGFLLSLSYVKLFVVGCFSAISDHEELHQRGQRPLIKSILSILGTSQDYQSNKALVFPPPRHSTESSALRRREGDHILACGARVPPESPRAVTTGKERGHRAKPPQHHGVGWGRGRMER